MKNLSSAMVYLKSVRHQGLRASVRDFVARIQHGALEKRLSSQLTNRYPSGRSLRRLIELSVTPTAGVKTLLTDIEFERQLIPKNFEVCSSLSELTAGQIKAGTFVPLFTCDDLALPNLRAIRDCGGKFVSPKMAHKHSYRFVDSYALRALEITASSARRISHFDVGIHENICEAVRITSRLEGSFVEIGVYKGGSALTALSMMTLLSESGKGVKRDAWLLDTFEGFSYGEAFSSPDSGWADTHQLFGVAATIEFVSETLSRAGHEFRLRQCEIIHDELPSEIQKIALVNMDVDLYDATAAALNKVGPLVVPGGIIICEDPASTPMLYGAYMAMHDFLETAEGRNFTPVYKTGQYFLIRR